MAGEYNKSHEYDTKAEEAGPVETQAHDMQDRGLFDFLGKKKEEKPQEEGLASEFDEKVKVSESEPSYVDYSKPAEHGYHTEEHKKEEHKEEEKKHETLSEKLRRSDSSSSSSSDEEGDDEEKKKKRKEKKGLKEKLKEKLAGDKEEEQKKHGYEQDTDEIPVEKFHEDHGHAYDHGPVHHEEPKVEHVPAAVVYAEEEKKEEEKKGFLEKIKDKLPGHKKPEEVPVASPPPPEYETAEPAHHEGEAKEKKGLLEKIKEKMPGYHPKTEEEKEKEKEKTPGSY